MLLERGEQFLLGILEALVLALQHAVALPLLIQVLAQILKNKKITKLREWK